MLNASRALCQPTDGSCGLSCLGVAGVDGPATIELLSKATNGSFVVKTIYSSRLFGNGRLRASLVPVPEYQTGSSPVERVS